MKKIIICLLLCLSVLGFVACGKVPEGEYWTDARAELSSIYGNEKYSAIKNLDYSENIKYFLQVNDEFKELNTVYANTLSACLSFNLSSYNILAVVPNTNNRSFYDKLNALVSNSKKFENDIDTFLNNKAYFEGKIDEEVSTYGRDYVLTDNISLNYLLKFKRDYLALIEKAYSLANDFSSMYSEGYINLEKVSLKNEENVSYNLFKILSLNTTNLKTVKNLINVIKEYDCRAEIKQMHGIFELQNLYYSKMNNENNFSETENDYENFVNWQNIFKKYNNEQKEFENILNKIDMLEIARDYDNNIEKYAKDKNNSQLKVYYEYVMNFAETENILINATYKFCNI